MILAAAAPALLLVGCGGKEETPPPPATSSEGKEESCEELCEEVKDCEGVDTGSCAESCASNKSTSRAGQEAFASCFNSSICAGEDETGLVLALACVPSQLAGIELSDSQTSYCRETVPKYNECVGSAPEANPLGDCESLIGAVSDESLAAFNACAAEDCGAIEACVGGALLTSLDLGALLLAGEGELDPTTLTSLITLGIVAGQLGTAEGGSDFTGGFDLGDLFGGEETIEEPAPVGTAGAPAN